MKKNKVKDMLRRGETVVGTWLDELRSPSVVQILAAAGLDFVIVDMEHGPYNLETTADIVRMARQVDITPLVRVPALRYEWVGRLLDAGVQGLMLPRVRTASEIEEFVSYVKYPPAGQRGMASGLGNTDFQWVTTPEYIDFSNGELLVIIQIETAEVVTNLETITSAPGVDVFFIGPEDLSIALGLPGQQDHPRMRETIQKLIAAVAASGRTLGIHSSDPAALPGLRGQGMRFITYASDVEFLYTGAQQGVVALRDNVEQPHGGGKEE